MPSGPKKRKAARRKKEEMHAHHPPDSPTNAPHAHVVRSSPPSPSFSSSGPGNGASGEDASDHHITDEEAEETKKQQAAEDAGAATTGGSEDSAVKEEMASSENGKGESGEGTAAAPKPEEVAVVKEGMLAVEEHPPKAEDVRIESIEATKDDESSAAAGESPLIVGPTDVAVAQSVPVTEEIIQAIEAQAVSTDALVLIDAPSEKREVKVAPLQAAAGDQSREVTITTEAAPAQLVEGRARWWNCCGLLDLLAGSQR